MKNVSKAYAQRVIRWISSMGGQAVFESNAEKMRPEEMTSEDWYEAKLQAIKEYASSVLDTPENHLTYLRERIAGNGSML